ncbi:MAG: hypothetical protein K9K65_11355 [Desulfarculaceae bacterium]|nr:hypothetical protein [Desulfarculaceae bacterium]MCF8049502.1 hypothetical protein [Desulfarculaceae bacterium]MCF8064599.1 hypothetical protein [Desulfarculaceae bacterium]MCF8098432.1 hypothetical protein [Desulfarculaceae bacterium]MCF8124075.1 hypothetical protein [Desulfarculaceae bacterium]
MVLPVVADALERGGEVAKLGMAVFRQFNHLYGARKLSGYEEVLAEVKARGEKVPLDRYLLWLVVIARSGAWLRAIPSAGAKGLAALPRGLTVRKLERRGEWVRVRSVGPGSVDPHFQVKAGFVHGSLLAPY